ncbi:6362_t:CDS:2, partial [Cetraspora pellucida]
GEQPVCLSCQPQAKLRLQAANKILQGQIVDVEALDLLAEDKINLSTAQKLMQGQPDSLPRKARQKVECFENYYRKKAFEKHLKSRFNKNLFGKRKQ